MRRAELSPAWVLRPPEDPGRGVDIWGRSVQPLRAQAPQGRGQGPPRRGGCPWVHDVNVPNTRFFRNSWDPKGRGEGWRSQCESARHTVILSSFWNMPQGQGLGSDLYTRHLISSFPWQPHATSSVIIFLLQTRKPGLRWLLSMANVALYPRWGLGLTLGPPSTCGAGKSLNK